MAAFLEMRLLEDRISCRKNGALSVVRAGTDGVPQAWGRQAPQERARGRLTGSDTAPFEGFTSRQCANFFTLKL